MQRTFHATLVGQFVIHFKTIAGLIKNIQTLTMIQTISTLKFARIWYIFYFEENF